MEAELAPQQQVAQQVRTAKEAGAMEQPEQTIMREVFPTREATAPVEGMGRM